MKDKRSHSVSILYLVVLTALAMLIFPVKVFAVPACPSPFELKQPSGKTFEARKRGDEWYNWVETKDGYGIYKNTETGYWEYYVPSDETPKKEQKFRIGRKQDAKKRAIVSEVDPATLGIPKGLRPPRKEDGRTWKPTKPKTSPPISPHTSPLPQGERESSLPQGSRLGEAERTQQENEIDGFAPLHPSYRLGKAGDSPLERGAGGMFERSQKQPPDSPSAKGDLRNFDTSYTENGLPKGKEENSTSTAVSGTMHLLVIGVDYDDTPATYSASEVQPLIFGSSNSVADYYNDVSYSAVTISPASESSGTSNDGFIGWLRLSGNHPNPGSNTGNTNTQIAKNAILAADSYIDFASYDTDGDGIVGSTELAIVVIVAGYEAAYDSSYSPSVWAHYSYNSSGITSVDGKNIHMYAQFGEKHDNHLATIGVMCHELGHLIFSLPDLYDTDSNNGDSAGVGDIDIMCSGSWGAASGSNEGSSPTQLSAWSKEYLSWGTVNTILSSQTISLPKADSNKASIFRINTFDSNQYFLIENREFSGYDIGFQRNAGASGHGGIVIYHIDKLKTEGTVLENNEVNADENDKGVDIEEANEASLGYSMLDNDTSEFDTNMLFFSGNNIKFTNDTTPDSRLKNGGSTNISVTDISTYRDTMTANISLSSQSPMTVTNSVTNIASSSATLHGTANANGLTATVWFEYGTNSGSYSNTTSTQTISGASDTAISFGISGLKSGTTYYYRFVAQNSAGTSYGKEKNFTTAKDSTTTSVTPKISAGGYHSLFINSDGTVWAWGNNSMGQLGDGTYTNSNTPVQVNNLSGNVRSIAGGHGHSLTLKSDGTVWAWGNNWEGELGDGTTITRKTPVQVSNISGVTAIAAGSYHSLFLKSDGTVWACGSNDYGQLGDGTTTDRATPVQVSGLSDVAAISAGGSHSLALKSDGSVWAWGTNQLGQLGDGTTTNRNTAVQISSLSGITAIAGGHRYSLALKSDGTVYTWGSNYYGQLGDGTYTDRNTPVKVSGLSGVTAIAAGGYHSMILKSDGTVWTWGNNENGQLGNGDNSDRRTPVQVSNLSGITAIAGGDIHSMALKSDNTVWTWGDNEYGQLGDETYTQRNNPVQVTNFNPTTATPTPSPSPSATPIPSPSQTPTPKQSFAIASGGYHNLALKSDGTVLAWGNNFYGQVGDGTTESRNTTALVKNLSDVIAIDCGYLHSLALKSDGTVWAWGNNSYGQLGDGTTTRRTTPVQVSSLSGVIAIAGGSYHSLALKSDGTVWAWGYNGDGELGDSTSTNKSTPVQVNNLSNVVAIAGGGHSGWVMGFSLALKSDGTVWAWGDNSNGQLGDGTYVDRNTPEQVTGVSGVTAIAGGVYHSLALKSDGTVWAWGWNKYGQLGDGSNTDSTTPKKVNNLSNIQSIASKVSHNLALKSEGTVWAWGYNSYGQLGDGTTVDRNTPVQVSNLSEISAIAAGVVHSIALQSNGDVWVWGCNEDGQLADTTISQKKTPVQVNTISNVDTFACGGAHTLALKSDDTVWACGWNEYGQLGDGTTNSRNTPVQANNLNNVTFIASKYSHNLALKSDGTVWTWGSNDNGQLGDGTYTDRSTPFNVSSLNSIIAGACGMMHSLALKSDGTVWAWGYNGAGGLGDGTTQSKKTPVQVKNLSGIKTIACGTFHSLALKSDGTVWTWGYNYAGQLGDGTTTNRTTPVQVSNLNNITAIACGADFSLALKSDGTVWAWGENSFYQLGDNTVTKRTTPGQITSLSDVISITGGAYHGIALKSDKTVWVWGYSYYGLGDGTTQKSTPEKINNLNNVTAIFSGPSHNFIMKSDNTIWSWGNNLFGQLGIGSSGISTSPVQVDINLNETTPTPTPSDTTAPSGSISINNGASYANSLTVTLTLTATDSVGVTGYYLSNSSTSPSASASGWISVALTTSYSATVSYSLNSGEGNKTIYVWYKDAAGNVSSTASDTIILDTTVPTVTISSPTSSSTYTSASSTISLGGRASDSSSGISRVTWSNSRGGSGTASGTMSWSISNISLSSGENVITVTAKDGVGNTATDTITVTYTTSTKPTPSTTVTPTPSSTPVVIPSSTQSSTPTPVPTTSPNSTPLSTCTDDYEPNDSLDTAYGPLVLQSSYSGKICSPFDIDYFKINVKNPGLISLALNIPPDKDYELFLYDSRQSFVASSTMPLGIPETITYFANTTGAYYIQVFGYNGSYDENQTYTLSGTWETTATTPTPPPIVCEAESIKMSQARLVLGKGQSGKVTVSVIGTNCPVEDMIVEVTITVGSRCISVSPVTQQTDENGKATFVIKAKDKIGRAKVTFKAGILEKILRVKVKK